jgi:hypothetical protein
VWVALIKKLGLIFEASISIIENYYVCNYYFILQQHFYFKLSLLRVTEVTELCAGEQTNIRIGDVLVHHLKFP